MSEIFPKGTEVRIGSEYTQSMETMDVVFEVQSRLEGDRIFGPKYRVTSPDGREWEFRAYLLERVEASLEEKVIEALKDGLGEDALVCTRDWSGWDYGTMSEDDFEQVADHKEWLREIAKAVLKVVQP